MLEERGTWHQPGSHRLTRDDYTSGDFVGILWSLIAGEIHAKLSYTYIHVYTNLFVEMWFNTYIVSSLDVDASLN